MPLQSHASSSFTSPHPTATPTLYPSANPPTISPTNEQKQLEMKEYVLSLINIDRQQNGLQNVSLSAVNSAQIHADDMLEKGYFSHWDTNGYKPYMRYTLAEGKGSVAENCAAQLGYYSNLKEALKDMEWGMMYDDAASNWGHKDNILNPLHNKVSVGIAYDSRNVYLVQDFEDDYVTWSQLTVSSSQVNMQGSIGKQGLFIQSVTIFYDNPTNLTTSQLDVSPYDGGYDPGTYVGMALPPDWDATGAVTITADTWTQNANNVQISFSLSKAIQALGKGVYTLYLQTGPSTADSLTTYSIWIR